MFSRDLSGLDLAVLTAASVLLTIPFIFYAKDISRSLRIIAEKTAPAENRNLPAGL